MSNTTPAWLLHMSGNIKLSIAEHQAAEYIENPTLHHVPVSNSSCNKVVLWRENIVPVLDMNTLFGNPASTDYKRIVVVAYQEEEGKELKYTAILLSLSPEKILIDDDDVCEFPEDYPVKLKPHAISLFRHQSQLVSIFNFASLSDESYS